MSLVTWIKELFGTRWSDKEVVQYIGDTMDHGIDETQYHIQQLRNRRPSLHQHQRLLVDAKIRELEADLKLRHDRDEEAKRVKDEAKRAALDNLAEGQRRANEAHNVKPREASKPVTGNVIAKPPKFEVDVDDNVGWTTPAPTHSYSTPSYHGGGHSSSHSPSYSHSHSSSCSHSHSSSDSSSSSSDSGSSSSSCD